MFIVQNVMEPASLRNALVDMIATGITDVRVASAYVTLGSCSRKSHRKRFNQRFPNPLLRHAICVGGARL